MAKLENTNNKKVKITFNNLDKNMDIDSIFREMDKCFSKVEANIELTSNVSSGNSNISIEIIDGSKKEKEKKEPKNLSFKKWIKWMNS